MWAEVFKKRDFSVHCRPLQGATRLSASGVFMISNSDSEKGWFFSETKIGRGLQKVGSPFNLCYLFVALYLYLHFCILLCQHEVVSPLGNPG